MWNLQQHIQWILGFLEGKSYASSSLNHHSAVFGYVLEIHIFIYLFIYLLFIFFNLQVLEICILYETCMEDLPTNVEANHRSLLGLLSKQALDCSPKHGWLVT